LTADHGLSLTRTGLTHGKGDFYIGVCFECGGSCKKNANPEVPRMIGGKRLALAPEIE